ncbi:hypothetical protein [Jeongeupia naejangsanensis]|uniref:Uncharacterized protein n=1 Tax=Jeongeupia naejangsanensis TaxID=613195 RepID=A0ABS2BH28_9NEIS|nr:hypothetical protein [Jeongeupia naejangsanensis]MBM3114903.1 hypothetical protein [Jeongeupia naejangsanensis]
MRFITLFLLIPASFFGRYALADPADPCLVAYKDQLSNIDINIQKLAIKNQYFNKFCKSDGSINESDTGLGVAAIVASVPISAQFAFSSKDQTVSQFCSDTAKSSDVYSYKDTYTKTSMDYAQKNFNQCLEISKQNLVVTYTYTPPNVLTIIGRNNNGYMEVQVDDIEFDKSKLKCTTPRAYLWPKELEPKSAVVKFDRDFSINCVRVPDSPSGGSYSAATLVLTIGRAGVSTPYEIYLPQDKYLGPALQSTAKTEIDRLQKRVDDSEKSVSLLTESNQILGRKVKDMTIKEIRPFYVGEYGRNLAGPKFYCGADGGIPGNEAMIENLGKEVCGKTMKGGGVQRLNYFNGNKCGYSEYIVRCYEK